MGKMGILDFQGQMCNPGGRNKSQIALGNKWDGITSHRIQYKWVLFETLRSRFDVNHYVIQVGLR